MNNIKAVLKSYPLAVIAAFVLFVAIVGLFVMVIPAGAAFRADMAARSKEIDKLKALQNNKELIPPTTPDGLPVEIPLVVNEPAIAKLQEIFDKMAEEYEDIFEYAKNFNENGHDVPNPHRPMLEGLFPVPSDIGKPFDAKVAYRDALVSMLAPYSDTARYPRLDAAPPLTNEVLTEEILKEEDKFLASAFPIDPTQRDVKNLRPDQALLLEQLKLKRMFEMYRSHAQRIHAYVTTTDLESPDFPLEVGEWSKPGDQPTVQQLWEGQMSLWIIQDILRAVEITNESHDNKKNVLTAPVKHLVKVSVEPGYVGINSRGGFLEKPGGGRRELVLSELPTGAGNAPQQVYDQSATGEGAAAAAPLSEDVKTFSADKPLPDDFSIAPTGRQSNDLYDVRHAKLEVIIESRKIPALMNNLAKVNFMTVLRATVTNVDEYEPLLAGFIYGQQDAVKLDLLIETVWLRNWTRQYMPQQIKYALGVETRPAPEAAPQPQ
jgi:hypothetical protein